MPPQKPTESFFDSINLREVIKFAVVVAILGGGWMAIVNYYIVPTYYPTPEQEILTFRCDLTNEIIEVNKSEPYVFKCGFIFHYGVIKNVKNINMDNSINSTLISTEYKIIN